MRFLRLLLPGVLLTAGLYALAESTDAPPKYEQPTAAFFLEAVERTKTSSFHWDAVGRPVGKPVDRRSGDWQPSDGELAGMPALFAFDNLAGHSVEVIRNTYVLRLQGGGSFTFTVQRGYVTHISQRIPGSSSYDVTLSNFGD